MWKRRNLRAIRYNCHLLIKICRLYTMNDGSATVSHDFRFRCETLVFMIRTVSLRFVLQAFYHGTNREQ